MVPPFGVQADSPQWGIEGQGRILACADSSPQGVDIPDARPTSAASESGAFRHTQASLHAGPAVFLLQLSQGPQSSRRALLSGLAAAPLTLLAPGDAPAAPSQSQAIPADAQKFDVVVAGGGAAGCMAARTAAKAGRRVLLVQALPMLGGTSAISSGWVRACATKWHEVRGIHDSADAYRDDIIAYGRGSRNEKKAAMIAREATVFVNDLIGLSVEFTDEEDRMNGGETLRVVKTKGAGGALMKRLAEAVKADPNITVQTGVRLEDVILTNGAVAGVRLERKGIRTVVRTPAVVLATGGFGRNQAMIDVFTPPWSQTGRIMDVGCRGDGLQIATELGAGALNLNIAMVCPTLEVTKGIFFSSAPLLMGGIIVNEKGRRFTNEYVIYTQTNIDMLKQKACWEIVTRELHPVVEGMIEKGVATECATVEDLARLIGCDPAGLRADIEAHNAQTRMDPKDRRDPFGRTVYGKELRPPFYALRIKPVMLETVGGFMIDEKCRVTTLLGRPVAAGLFGAGAAAFGEHFGVGYRSGEAYAYAGATGITAGREAAAV